MEPRRIASPTPYYQALSTYMHVCIQCLVDWLQGRNRNTILCRVAVVGPSLQASKHSDSGGTCRARRARRASTELSHHRQTNGMNGATKGWICEAIVCKKNGEWGAIGLQEQSLPLMWNFAAFITIIRPRIPRLLGYSNPVKVVTLGHGPPGH